MKQPICNHLSVSNIANTLLAKSQSGTPAPEPVLGMAQRHMNNLGTMIGRPFTVNNEEKIKGSPYFIDSFTTVTVRLKDDKVYAFSKTRLNLLSNQLHFMNNEDVVMVAEDRLIREVVSYQLAGDRAIPVIFGCGYPRVNKNNEFTKAG
jgi:hypothetical protein